MSSELYLIDGYSVIYRGYFAFLNKPLRNPMGQNTSSVFVFFRTLFQLMRDRAPGYLAIAMDSRVPTFRHIRYEQYKATREKAPEDLHAQVPIIEEILAALHIPSVRRDGYEADDIMATLAEGCRGSGRPCWILSGDKDIMQLIGGNVRLLAPERGTTDLAEYTREKVFEAKGVYPEQIIDFLALTGDASDNVPGVAGVGEKTAQKLLAQFGDIDSLYNHLGEVSSESIRKKLESGRDSAYLSRELVTLKRDVPDMPGLETMEMAGLNLDAAVPFFEREGMKSLVTELTGLQKGTPRVAQSRLSAPTPQTAPTEAVALKSTAPGTYTTITALSELDLWIERARHAGVYAFDVETDSTDELQALPLGFSLSFEEGGACYIPIRAHGVSCLPEDTVKARLKALLEDQSVKLVGQNVKYDYKVVRRWGVHPAAIHFDTMVAAWVLDSDEGMYGLDRMAERRLSFRTKPYTDLVGKGQTLEDLPIQDVTDYSGEDADLTLRMFHLLSREIEAEGLHSVFYDIEIPLIEVLAEMELTGIRILSPALAAYSREMEKSMVALEDEIYMLCGRKFNIASTKQLQEILFTWRKLTPVKKTKTGFSTDMDVLEILAEQDPVPEKILAHRKLSKLKSTYVDALPLLVNERTGRLHTHYVQTGAATGRLSSKDPNLQNIPIREEEGRRIRAAFVPSPGMSFVSADYAQIELAILAHLSQDPTLLQAFREGKDIHRQTAALIFGVEESAVTPEQRRVGKTINFGVVYGMSAFGLAGSLKIPRAAADTFITTYFFRFPGVSRFLRETVQGAEKTGYVYTLKGRRRKIAGITSKNRTEKQGAERVAVNSPIQGSAADIVKMAMIRLHKRLLAEGNGARILLQVHDELILEVPEGDEARIEKIVREIMEGVGPEGLPLKVQCESGDSWGAFH